MRKPPAPARPAPGHPAPAHPAPGRRGPAAPPLAWLARRIEELRPAGRSKAGLARALGLPTSRISEIISAKRRVDAGEIKRLAAYLDWTVGQVLDRLDPDHPLPAPTVPLVGQVGAGALVLPIEGDAPLDHVELPADLAGAMVAVVVRGDSMVPAYREGDLIFYDAAPAPPAAVLARAGRGRAPECVVALADGRVMIKQITRGAAPDRWTLLSYNGEPLVDVAVDWAVPVRWVRRAG